MKKQIWTSVWSAKHPNSGQNIPHVNLKKTLLTSLDNIPNAPLEQCKGCDKSKEGKHHHSDGPNTGRNHGGRQAI